MTMKPKVTQLPAGEFKAKCLSVLDDVERTRRTVVVTKRGRPVAQVVPLPAVKEQTLRGSLLFEVVPLPAVKGQTLRGSLLFEEDLLAPVNVAWE